MVFVYDMQSDEELLRDQREREKLEQNLRERDAAATRKVRVLNWNFGFLLQGIGVCFS